MIILNCNHLKLFAMFNIRRRVWFVELMICKKKDEEEGANTRQQKLADSMRKNKNEK